MQAFEPSKVGLVHTGRPITLAYANGIAILCSEGHVLSTVPQAEWVGSVWEGRLGNAQFVVNCKGIV